MRTALTAFLSHSSQDSGLAQRLCDELEKRNVRCWIAPRDIPPGHSWADSIVDGIEGCSAFVLLATVRSVLSRDVLIEVERAHRLSRPIYTIMVDKPPLVGEMTYYLTRLQWIESKQGGIGEAGSRLADVLSGVKRWEAVATPPSLARRLRWVLPSFAGALVATIFGLCLLSAAIWYAVHRVQRAIVADYRSIGWTTFGTLPGPNASGTLAVGHVWLGDPNRPFSTVRLNTHMATMRGEEQRLDLTPQLPKDGTGEAEFKFPMLPDLAGITTLLRVPNSSGSSCVTQRFAVRSGQVIESGEAIVTNVPDVGSCSK